jgi:glucose/mannose-6-phosphate isomerase
VSSERESCGSSETSALDDSAAWRQFDPEGMVGFASAFPRQCDRALQLADAWALPAVSAEISEVVVAGMGGSAAGGDLLQALAEKPAFVVRGYEIPPYVGPGTLFFAVSHSGDTEETISAYEAAKERAAAVLVVTSGGKLGAKAQADGTPLCLVPGGQPPRTSFGYLCLPLLHAAQRYGALSIAEGEREEMLTLLEGAAEEWGPQNPTPENAAKRLALALNDVVPIVYGSSGVTATVALRWKTQFNENAKIPSFFYSFPEMNHNEIMGWEGVQQGSGAFAVVLLRDKAESPRIRARFEITKSLIRDKVAIYEVWSRGNHPLARAMYLNYLGDWVTVYSALLRGVDPAAIQSIKTLKQALSKI